MSLKSTGFNFFVKIMGRNYVFCCSSQISFSHTNQLNGLEMSKQLNANCKVFAKTFLGAKKKTCKNGYVKHCPDHWRK